MPSDKPAMTLGDYIDMIGAEDRIVPIAAEEKRNARLALYGFPVLRDATPEQRAKLDALPQMAQCDARPADGKFPLILYSLGSAALAATTPEYLASHGYVVMQMPRLGAFAGAPPDDPSDTALKVADTEFMLQVAHELPQADVENIGAIGFSAGGRWALSEAMRNDNVHAVVSLDTVMLFDDATAKNWRALPFYSVDAVRVPVLHLVRREWIAQQDASMWSAMRCADRTMLVFEDPKLQHLDFQSIGYAMSLVGMHGDAETFDTFNRQTLQFLDAHLKSHRGETPTPVSPAVTLTHLAATPAPLTFADVMNAVAAGNVDALVKAAKTLDIPEQTINLAGYNVLFGGNPKEAIRIFQINVDRHPDSANAYDSLADAYVAVGDKNKAAELARVALTKLDADTTSATDRKEAIRNSIRQKLGASR
jgi:dienelactone hydrolase